MDLCKTVSKRALTEVVSAVNLAPPTPTPTPTVLTYAQVVTTQATAGNALTPAPPTPVPAAFPAAPAFTAIPALAATLATAAALAVPTQERTTRELASPSISPMNMPSSPVHVGLDLDQIVPGYTLADTEMLVDPPPPCTQGNNVEPRSDFDDQANIFSSSG
jgi:hypothetical protein